MPLRRRPDAGRRAHRGAKRGGCADRGHRKSQRELRTRLATLFTDARPSDAVSEARISDADEIGDQRWSGRREHGLLPIRSTFGDGAGWKRQIRFSMPAMPGCLRTDYFSSPM